MQESLKAIKLISELTGFILKTGGEEIDINLKDKEDQIRIIIKSRIENLQQEDLEVLKSLNTPRQSEVEDYYWELAGENENYQELTLVGMIIDKAEYNYENDILTITVYRHK
jgi:hypothetical protein